MTERDPWAGYSEAPGHFDAKLRIAVRAVGERDLGVAASATPRALAAIMMDIDHFKKVNDTYGHRRGDEVLVSVASTLRQIIGRRGRAYRWGGEEFVVLLPGFSEGEAAAVGERLRAAIEGADLGRQEPKSVTASFGVAELSPEEDPAAFIERADKALYRAKNGGRNRVVASEGSYGLRPAPRLPSRALIADDDRFTRDIIVNFLSRTVLSRSTELPRALLKRSTLLRANVSHSPWYRSNSVTRTYAQSSSWSGYFAARTLPHVSTGSPPAPARNSLRT